MTEGKPISADEFMSKLRHIKQFSRAGRRAIHKPVLLLYALAQLKHHHREHIAFKAAEELLEPLLKTYGPTGTRARVSDPFARLEGDKIWELKVADRGSLFDKGGNVKPRILKEQNVEAGFIRPVLALLRNKPALIDAAALDLLSENLPNEVHPALLAQVGLRLDK